MLLKYVSVSGQEGKWGDRLEPCYVVWSIAQQPQVHMEACGKFETVILSSNLELSFEQDPQAIHFHIKVLGVLIWKIMVAKEVAERWKEEGIS